MTERWKRICLEIEPLTRQIRDLRLGTCMKIPVGGREAEKERMGRWVHMFLFASTQHV